MKEIWINLELYFESYEFSNFRDSFRILLNLFLIFKVLKQLKKGKKGVYFCARSMWMRRATRPHASAYVARM